MRKSLKQIRPLVLGGSLLAALAVPVGTSAVSDAYAMAPNCNYLTQSGVAADRIIKMQRGVNLTGWLENDDRTGFDELLGTLLKKGLTHIRLPVNGERLMPRFADQATRDRYLDRLDYSVTSLLLSGFAVSIDMHPAGRFQKLHRLDPETAFTELKQAWLKLAARLKDLPKSRVYFELLNEPTAPVDVWHDQAKRLIASLRRIVPSHTLIYGPGGYQRIDVLTRLKPFTDTNIVYAAHFYDPMVFTHQGLDWAPGDPLGALAGVPFPLLRSSPEFVRLVRELEASGRTDAVEALREATASDWTEERVAKAIEAAESWSKQYNVPVIINEFGVLNWKADATDRARWLSSVTRAAQKGCIGWTHWELTEGFGFASRDRDGTFRIDRNILKALTGK